MTHREGERVVLGRSNKKGKKVDMCGWKDFGEGERDADGVRYAKGFSTLVTKKEDTLEHRAGRGKDGASPSHAGNGSLCRESTPKDKKPISKQHNTE